MCQERKADTVTLLLDMKIRARGPGQCLAWQRRVRGGNPWEDTKEAVGSAAQPSSGSHAVYGAGGLGCGVWCSPVLLSQDCSWSSVCTHHSCQGLPGWKAVFSECSGISQGAKKMNQLLEQVSESDPITGLDRAGRISSKVKMLGALRAGIKAPPQTQLVKKQVSSGSEPSERLSIWKSVMPVLKTKMTASAGFVGLYIGKGLMQDFQELS